EPPRTARAGERQGRARGAGDPDPGATGAGRAGQGSHETATQRDATAHAAGPFVATHRGGERSARSLAAPADPPDSGLRSLITDRQAPDALACRREDRVAQ